MQSELPSAYLELFKELKNPPKKLYYKGNLKLLEQRKIAIIGSRRMSTYTKNCVFELSNLLKNSKISVVSGGALGVDISASMAAMPNTIGVFANGLDEIYPRSNEKIIKQIYENALALSENESYYKPKPYDFLLRNRLIVALSEAVVVAQADLQSELNKPLYVLPQRKNESDGTNLLLQEKNANLLLDFKEFASCFGAIEEEKDEFLDFCRQGVSVDEATQIYGEKVYEYELEGKISIEGLFIRVLV